MGMQINTNLAANNAYRNLSNTQNDLSKSLEKLSSGLRINRAGDDAAGLAISEGLKSQIGGLGVAARNAQDGISAVQTAEGGLSQTQSILQRLRDLAVQAANDTNNADSRAAIKTEADSLVSELGRIATVDELQWCQAADGTAGGTATEVPGRRQWRRGQPDRRRPHGRSDISRCLVAALERGHHRKHRSGLHRISAAAARLRMAGLRDCTCRRRTRTAAARTSHHDQARPCNWATPDFAPKISLPRWSRMSALWSKIVLSRR